MLIKPTNQFLVKEDNLYGPITVWQAGDKAELEYTTVGLAARKIRDKASRNRWIHPLHPEARERWDAFQKWFELAQSRFCSPLTDEFGSEYKENAPNNGGWIRLRIVSRMLEVYYESGFHNINGTTLSCAFH
jgi:hypothetical protein